MKPSVGSLALAPLRINGGDGGSLVAVEQRRQMPFEIVRAYYIWGVPTGVKRGQHAHHAGHQFFICVQGACLFTCDDGAERREFVLDRPDVGLHVPPMIWGEQVYRTADAMALVFADQTYDRADYIEDYDEFRRLAAAR